MISGKAISVEYRKMRIEITSRLHIFRCKKGYHHVSFLDDSSHNFSRAYRGLRLVSDFPRGKEDYNLLPDRPRSLAAMSPILPRTLHCVLKLLS
jgi:hypothetical protein